MADLRIPAGATPSLVRPATPARSEAVLAAQRAFFEAALGQAQTPAAAPARPVQAAAPAAPARPIARAATARLDPQAPSERLLRPGSIIDIKV